MNETGDSIPAVIRRRLGSTSLALTDVAGRPLVLRQLQWLHANRCAPVVLEVADDADGLRLLRWLATDALGSRVEVLIGGCRTPLDWVRRRFGFDRNRPMLAIDDNAVCDTSVAHLTSNRTASILARLSPPRACSALAGTNLYAHVQGGSLALAEEGAGWGVGVRDSEEARALGLAALAGELPPSQEAWSWPILVHAASVASGVWVAHGARVSRWAKLTAPVLIGEHARVKRGARVGPRVVVARGAVVAAYAHVEDCFVAPGTRVGRIESRSG